MLTTNTRFQLLCALSLLWIGCGDDPAVERENGQPGDACTSTNDCAVGFECRALECSQIDPLRITLSWTVDTDFDLHVRTPNGSELYFGQANAQAYLGSDHCPMTVAEPTCGDESEHHEHAFLRALNLPGSGFDAGDTDAGAADPDPADDVIYEYWVENYGCDTAGAFDLEVVAKDGTVRATQSGGLPAACAESEHFLFNLND